VGVAISAPLAALAGLFGSAWSLRYAFVVFVLATILAILLPPRVDSAQGEERIHYLRGERASEEDGDQPATTGATRPKVRIPATMAFALRANCGPRWLSGFLTLFMAFLLREHPIGDHSTQFSLAVVIGAAGLGNFVAIGAGSLLKQVNPSTVVTLALLADVVATAFAALVYGLLSLSLLGFAAGLTQCLSKLALDSVIQRDVPERVRTSAFARSDTTLQLAWVLGGFAGIAMPLQPRLGMSVAAVVILAWSVFVLAAQVRRTTAGASARVPSRSQG
jgi:hypothetical protein